MAAIPTDDEKEDVLFSCRYGELEEVQEFVSKFGSEVLSSIQDDNGNNILHMASGNGHDNVLQYLLPLLPPTILRAQNVGKSTPLHWAALNQHLSTCKLLVNQSYPAGSGTGPDLIDIKNAAGRTPLDEAEQAGWQEGALWFVSVMNLEGSDVKAEEGDERVDDEDIGGGAADESIAPGQDIEVEIQDADGQIAKMSIAAKDIKR